MIQSRVGPPIVGATDLKSPLGSVREKDFKSSETDTSFDRAFKEKISLKAPDKEVREDRPKEDKVLTNREGDKKEIPKREAVSEEKVAQKSTARQKAIKEFMDSFESEFQIPPTRLVEAMAQLDNQQLTDSPEATADAVIDKLDLNEVDADKARAMYASLLVKLEQLPVAQAAPPVLQSLPSHVSGQSTMERAFLAQEKKSMMGASVDRLNQNFWMKQNQPGSLARLNMDVDEGSFLTDAEPLSAEQMAGLSDDSLGMTEGFEEMPVPVAPRAALPELPPHLQGQMKETINPSLLAALAAKREELQAQSSFSESSVEDGVDAEGSSLLKDFQQSAGLKSQPAANQMMTETSGEQASFFANNQGEQASMQQQQGEKSLFSSAEDKSAGEGKKTSLKPFSSALEGIHGAPIRGEVLTNPSLPTTAMGAPVMAGKAEGAENEAAVKQLMNQAQYLIKKGGGEMKVEMTPEGLGTVHLKVMLQDGKVNLQMSADTQEAKKTLESSLAELKTSLAAHKLSMDNVKVDVVTSTSTDTATQNQSNLNQQQRDQTRQFWNQFNDNFGSQDRRQAMTEMPNLRGYGRKERDPLQSIEAAQAPARKVAGKGSGLNLVA